MSFRRAASELDILSLNVASPLATPLWPGVVMHYEILLALVLIVIPFFIFSAVLAYAERRKSKRRTD